MGCAASRERHGVAGQDGFSDARVPAGLQVIAGTFGIAANHS